MPQTYTVQRGDTLFALARKFGVTVAAIVAANNIVNANLIRTGQVLTIPDSIARPPTPPSPPPPQRPTPPPTGSPSVVSYTVLGGDTLSAIALKFGVTVDAIVKANNISDPRRIRPGQVLVIPAKN